MRNGLLQAIAREIMYFGALVDVKNFILQFNIGPSNVISIMTAMSIARSLNPPQGLILQAGVHLNFLMICHSFSIPCVWLLVATE